jgi:hypothetical protein
MTIGNHFWSDSLRHVFKAFWRALERTDTLVVGLLILGGVGSLWFGGHAEHPSWQIALAIFLASLFVLLVKMPYRLYAEQRATIDSLNQRLARISEDRPLRFNDITIEKWIQHSPPYGLWTIERIGLEFENVGDQPLDWRITKLSVEYQNTETAIPLPGDGPDAPIVIGVTLGIFAVLVVQESDYFVHHAFGDRNAGAKKTDRANRSARSVPMPSIATKFSRLAPALAPG